MTDEKSRYLIRDGKTEDGEQAYKLVERLATDPAPKAGRKKVYPVAPTDTQFTTSGQYYCSKCGAKMPGEEEPDPTYNKKTDRVTCKACGAVLKVGDGDRGSGSDDPGDLDWSLFFVCPSCGKRHSEDDIKRIIDKEGEQIEIIAETMGVMCCYGPLMLCNKCGFIGTNEGSIA